MRLALTLALVCASGSAEAKTDQMLAALGPHGCTLGPQSRAALEAMGFDGKELDALASEHVATGAAKQERAYTVFSEEVCTIRIPKITTDASLTDPDIVAAISAPDHYVEQAQKSNAEFGTDDSGEGCYFMEMYDVFDARLGGARGAGTLDYIRFTGAHLISGDVRFYETSPLRTPIGLRVMTGGCAETEGAEAILENHSYFEEGFGRYARAVGADAVCGGDMSIAGHMETARLQGADPMSVEEPDPPINAWLWFEFELIARAAGFYEGMGPTSRGEPRPPLCHYAD